MSFYCNIIKKIKQLINSQFKKNLVPKIYNNFSHGTKKVNVFRGFVNINIFMIIAIDVENNGYFHSFFA